MSPLDETGRSARHRASQAHAIDTERPVPGIPEK